MKPLLALICAVAIGYVAYEFVYPPFQTYFGLAKVKEEAAPPPAPKPVITVSLPSIDKPKPAPKPEEPKPETKPMVTEAPPPPPPKPKADEFVPPTFRSIEEVTQGWSMIPKSVFPRLVKVSKELEVKGAVGATKIAAGANAYALSQDGANLVIAPSPESKFRGMLAIEETNIKDLVTGAYNNYMKMQTEAARVAFEAKKEAVKHPKKAVAAAPTRMSDDKPSQAKDGTYPLLLASMEAGEVTEIKKDNIKKWGDVKRTSAGGQEVWVVSLTFEATTPFGKFEQEALAHVKNSKVVKWLYAGSGEVVP